MKINMVTLTGVDSSVKSKDLISISEKYRGLVEWGILYGTKQNSPRYPNIGRILEFNDSLCGLKHAIHLCGDQAVKYYYGQFEGSWLNSFYFQRVQLNLPSYITENLKVNKVVGNVILQYNDQTKDVLVDWFNNQTFRSHDVLFDFSGGNGQRKKFEEMPSCFDVVGYAGGIGPDTVENDLEEISKVCNRDYVWIDMESSLRSIVNGKDIFDLDKCENVLDKVVQFNKNN